MITDDQVRPPSVGVKIQQLSDALIHIDRRTFSAALMVAKKTLPYLRLPTTFAIGLWPRAKQFIPQWRRQAGCKSSRITAAVLFIDQSRQDLELVGVEYIRLFFRGFIACPINGVYCTGGPARRNILLQYCPYIQ